MRFAHTHARRQALLLLSCALAVSACADAPPERAKPSSQSVLVEIRRAIGSAECTSDDQCHSLPVGAKSCGGPAGFVAWSSARTQRESLEALAATQRQLAAEEAARSGRVSDCRALVNPGSRCVAAEGRKACVLIGRPTAPLPDPR